MYRSFTRILYYFIQVGFFYTSMIDLSVADILSLGRSYSCAIQYDDKVICWGGTGGSQFKVPEDKFVQINAGGNFACGIRFDKTVICWGNNDDGRASPPEGEFLQISVGVRHVCGVKTDNTVVCWGSNKALKGEEAGQSRPPEDKFLQVSSGDSHTCGILLDHTIKCWGSNTDPWTGTVVDQSIPPEGTFLEVKAGGWHNCAIHTIDNTIICWGLDADKQSTYPPGTFSQLDSSTYYTCGLRTDKTIACWGWNKTKQSQPPYSQCTPLSENYPEWKTSCSMPSGSAVFTEVLTAKGGDEVCHSCARRPDNTIVCWGQNDAGQATPPPCLRLKSNSDGNQAAIQGLQTVLYGLHSDTENGDQLFVVDSQTLTPNFLGKPFKDYSFTAIDFHPISRELYVATGEESTDSGFLYKVVNGRLNKIGDSGLGHIESIAFHPDGTLWGWSAGEGLFTIPNKQNNQLDLKKLKILIPDNGLVKIHQLTWNTLGTLLYGVENTPSNVRLWSYQEKTGDIQIVCPNYINHLQAIQAIETMPDDSLLIGLQSETGFRVEVLNPKSCEVIFKQEILSAFNRIKGFAWPTCTQP